MRFEISISLIGDLCRHGGRRRLDSFIGVLQDEGKQATARGRGREGGYVGRLEAEASWYVKAA
jgi:hypothetical protein